MQALTAIAVTDTLKTAKIIESDVIQQHIDS